ncbi:DUF4873 domain-containing protein [Streptomyces sp. NPDC057757]|uniref:DUF4873 domain-containing protein n=1 Tax=Streptomyces sp. NPDC057757 TaxID=3346241 RepID=UPI0036A58CDC
MTTYDGPATVIADGTEFEVTAQLTITTDGRMKEWGGSLDVPDGSAAWTIFDARSAKLRVGDREGDFIAKGSSPAMDIQGSGRPPFGG